MSTRFFQSIRRNQRQWMVVVTVLSMVSFLFLDDFGRGKGPMSAFGGALMIGCLCAAAMCIIGYGRQKTAEFGIGGFLVGFIAGFIGFGAIAQNKPVARTSIGNLTRHDFDQMAQQRQRANQFLMSVARRVQGGPTAGFGGIDDQSLIQFRMLLDDAKKMGIRISDEGVNDFLKQLTRNRLTKQDFKESLRDARLGENELFDILKDELSVQLALQLMRPPAFVAQAPPGLAQYVQNREPLSYMQQTPQQLWESYQMMNLKQSLQAVAIPVQDFVSEVGQPADADLIAFFSKFKNNRWVDEARPGFVQMPRVRLAYFTADFEKFERGVEPSDEDVRAYYEKNKDRYRAPPAKESTAPKLPDSEMTLPEDSKNTPATPEAPEAPATPQEADKEASPPTKADEAGTSSDPKSDLPPKQELPVPEGAKDNTADEPKSNSQCGPESQGGEAEANSDKKTEEEPVKEGKTEAPPSADQPAEQNPAATPETPVKEEGEPKPTQKDNPDQAPPAVEATGSDVPQLSKSPQSLPEAKFRELNDELKLEIREAILRERTFTNIALALDKAYETMIPLGLEYDTATDEAVKKEKAKSISERLKQYAEANQLEYVETPEWEYEALAAEPIGMAVEGQGRSTVANDVMMRGERGESRIPLYSPRRADLRTKRGAFAYWKIDETPARVPELKEEAVREKVVRAWKFDQARLLAEKRAKALSDKAKAEGGNLSAAVSGESATGQKTDPALSVIETPEFTWLSTPQSIPSAQQEPMISDVPLISNAGNDFMKTVFEELNEGDIGVAVNSSRSVYYVVKVTGRESAKDDGGIARQEQHKRFFEEKFSGLYPIIKSPYESLAQYPQRMIEQAWRQSFEKRHNVEWEEETTPTRRRR